jgi:tripartite-type tricarboxylate transporter receptor subunit TctC
MKRRNLFLSLLIGVASSLSAPVYAQDWPSKTVSLVVPFTAGGSTDTVARLIAERLAPRLGQPVIVENRAGAGGALGSNHVAKSPADGYTLLVGTASTMAIAPHVYTKLPYQPVRDLDPITLLGTADIMIVVRADLPIKTVGELLSYARANPGKLTFASGGNGSISHLLGEYFKSMAKVDLVHVPYRGDAQMVIDLIGGQVDMAFGTAVAFLPHVKSGKVTALAVTNPKRSTTQTHLPTVGEAGVSGYEAVQWFGIAAPAGTPKPILQRLNREIVAILAMPDIRKRFGEMGFDVVGNSPEEFGKFLQAENAKWKMVADVSGTKLD